MLWKLLWHSRQEMPTLGLDLTTQEYSTRGTPSGETIAMVGKFYPH
jgi:hypothetical protein